MNVQPIKVEQVTNFCYFSMSAFVTFHNKRVKNWGICIYTNLKNAESEKKTMLFSLLNADCHSQKNKTLLQQKVAVREK